VNFRATALEIAAALAYLHGLNLLHGDLTGGNILLSSSHVNERGFCAKVADFGLSRTVGSEPIDVNTYGTVTHMPPELLTTGELTHLTWDAGGKIRSSTPPPTSPPSPDLPLKWL